MLFRWSFWCYGIFLVLAVSDYILMPAFQTRWRELIDLDSRDTQMHK
jgi:hypothetical protein